MRSVTGVQRLMDASNERFGYFVEGFLGNSDVTMTEHSRV